MILKMLLSPQTLLSVRVLNQIQVGLPGEKHLTNFKIELYTFMKCIKPHEKISEPAFISFSIMTQAIGMSIT